MVLYRKCVPGLRGTGWARNCLTEGAPAMALGSVSWPQVMVSRSRTVMALRLSEGAAGTSAGKNFRTGTLRFWLPSAIAKPTADALKLLLSDFRVSGFSVGSGLQPAWVITWPCRTT